MPRELASRSSLEAWLNGRSRDASTFALVIAVRASLRVQLRMSAVADKLDFAEWPPRLLLATFRANAAARTAACYPQQTIDCHAAAYSTRQAAKSTPTTERACALVAAAAESAAWAASAIAREKRSTSVAASISADEDAVISSGETAEAAASLDETTWVEIQADAESLADGASPSQLVSQRLWRRHPPQDAPAHWHILKSKLLERSGSHWRAWTDWYDARLRGVQSDERADVARLTKLRAEAWNQHPSIVNKEILDAMAPHADALTPATDVWGSPNTLLEKAPTPRIFVSHASAADGAKAVALAQMLEAAGQRCWLAPRNIPPGADWNGAIIEAIDACDAVVLLVSDASTQSPFVKAEVQFAFERSKRIVSVHLSQSADSGRIDLRLNTVQRLRGYPEADLPKLLQLLA